MQRGGHMGERLSRYYICVSDDFGTLAVCWLRQISAENESLITQFSKHRFYEMHYVLDGSIDFHTADGDITVNSGEFLLITPNKHHSIISYTPNARKLVFAFDVRLADASAAAELAKADLGTYIETDALRKMAELLPAIPDSSPTSSGVQIRCITEAFFIEVLKIIVPRVTLGLGTRLKADSRNETVERIYEFIRSRLGGEFPTVETVAEAFNMSRRHLSRITAETVGKTPKQILDEEKLAYIRELLATTDYTMHEIAFLTGFASEFSLARFFSSKENSTLNRYRKDTKL